MKNIILQLEDDIDRCKSLLNSRNSLEIALAMEEIIDKNKCKISNLETLNKDNVWSYNNEDLNFLLIKLEDFHLKLQTKYDNEIIKNVLSDKEALIKNMKTKINQDISLSKEDRHNIYSTLDALAKIDKRYEDKDRKWISIKPHIRHINNFDYNIGKYVIEYLSIIL